MIFAMPDEISRLSSVSRVFRSEMTAMGWWNAPTIAIELHECKSQIYIERNSPKLSCCLVWVLSKSLVSSDVYGRY